MTDRPLPLLDDIRRPRWRPAVPMLWRTPSSVQFGDEVIVDRVGAEHLAWLSGLDGSRTSNQVAADLPIHRSDASRLLSALAAAGGLVDAARVPDSARASAHARDEILRDLDVAVDTYRAFPAAFAAIANRDATRIAIGGTNPLAAALASAASDARVATVADTEAADLVILTDSHHPDVPAQLDPDLGHRPHLHVGVSGARAVVGPLVVPGITGCLRCAHLHRRDADPAWPVLAVQLTQAVRGRAEAADDPLLMRAAAVHALLLVRAFIDAPHDLTTWADAAIEIRLPGPSTSRIARPPHPLCGCRWMQGGREVAQ